MSVDARRQCSDICTRTITCTCSVRHSSAVSSPAIVRITIPSTNNNNTNTNDNVYGAVIMARLLREFIRFI